MNDDLPEAIRGLRRFHVGQIHELEQLTAGLRNAMLVDMRIKLAHPGEPTYLDIVREVLDKIRQQDPENNVVQTIACFGGLALHNIENQLLADIADDPELLLPPDERAS